MRKLILLFLLIFQAAKAQNQKFDTLVLDKMILGSIEEKITVGTAIDSQCSFINPSTFKPIHNYLNKVTLVTDYKLCNNGVVNMFFEIYDGENFKFVRDSDISFSKDIDKDQLKVTLAKRSEEERNFVRNHVTMMSDFIKEYGDEENEKEIDEERRLALKPFIETEKYGLGFVYFRPTEDYGSTGAEFRIFNPSKKTIKYIWFTIAGENAVEDLVRLSNGNYYKTLKGIGPVEQYDFVTWSFDYVWFTDIVQYIRMSSIKIQYMDGTFRTIKYNDNMWIGEEAYNEFNRLFTD